MSFRAVVWALSQNVPPREQLILIHLSDFYNDDLGYAFMHQDTLAKRSNYSRVTVNQALQKLETHYQLITTTNTHYPDGRRAGKRYFINFENGQNIPFDTTNSHVKDVNSGDTKVKNRSNQSKDPLHAKVKTVNNNNFLHLTSYKELKDTSSKTTIDYDEYLQAWNNNCGHLPKIRVLSQSRKRKIKQHIKEYGNDALPTFTQAVQAVANEDFWIERSYGIDNLLRDKITTYAEKHQATQNHKRPAILNINPEDLF